MKQFKNLKIKILLIIGLAFTCHAVFAQTVKEITAVDFHKVLENDYSGSLTIIDGRDSSMFQNGHIKGAINIDAFAGDVKAKLHDFMDEEQLIVYCTNFTRSETIIDILAKNNYQGEIIFVTDGITGWKNNGFDVVSNYPDKVSKSVSKDSHKLLPGLKPIVQVFGTASYDVENKHYGYNFGRAHLGFQYLFNERWNAKIIIDRGRATSVGDITVTDSLGNQMNVQNASTEGAYYTMFLKFASLQWKVNDKLTVEGGAILQNHYITQERFWSFRYIVQTFQDLYWKIPSSDLGFIAYCKINPVISFDAALTNGEGPHVKQDAFGKVKFAGGLNINPSGKIQTRMYYHNKQTSSDTLRTEQMFSVFAGYKLSEKLRVGGEYNYMDNLNNLFGLKSYGFSLYSAYQIVENTQLLVRFDRLLYDTVSNTITGIKGNGNALMGGVSYSPVKGVNLSLNYQGWITDHEENQLDNNILFSVEYKFLY